jgi:hypothetical protein
VFFKGLNPDFLSQAAIYDAFARVFGADNIILRRYRHAGLEHINDFLTAIGVSGMPNMGSDDLPPVNRAQPLDKLELERVSKRGNRTVDAMTLSRVGSLGVLAAKIDEINQGFDRISSLSDAPCQSDLSLLNVFTHHLNLTQTLIDAGVVNNKEAIVLRDYASSVANTDPELALCLIRGAANIRPTGQIIAAKLIEYEAAALAHAKLRRPNLNRTNRRLSLRNYTKFFG